MLGAAPLWVQIPVALLMTVGVGLGALWSSLRLHKKLWKNGLALTGISWEQRPSHKLRDNPWLVDVVGRSARPWHTLRSVHQPVSEQPGMIMGYLWGSRFTYLDSSFLCAVPFNTLTAPTFVAAKIGGFEKRAWMEDATGVQDPLDEGSHYVNLVVGEMFSVKQILAFANESGLFVPAWISISPRHVALGGKGIHKPEQLAELYELACELTSRLESGDWRLPIQHAPSHARHP